MNNKPANPILHSLVFLLTVSQFAVGTQLCRAAAYCEQQPLLLTIYIAIGAILSALLLLWLKELSVISRISHLSSAGLSAYSKEIKTLTGKLKQRENPGTVYPLLAELAQLLGLTAVGLAAISGLLYGLTLDQSSPQHNLFYCAHIGFMAAVGTFVIGHVGMAVLHKKEQQALS